MPKGFRVGWIILGYLLLIASISDAQQDGETRALWVRRWDFRSVEDIAKIVQNASSYRFNTLLFQVRGSGTVFYPSQFEPWAEEIGGRDPGFDPLRIATQLAHDANLELHAWINVYPGWGGTGQPKSPSQLYRQHRDWFMVDFYGRPQELNRQYVWLSPTHPRVEDYLLQLCHEIYSHYAVDGLHLDYVRYPGNNYSYDKPSIQVFTQKYTRAPHEIPEEWSRWRRDAISGFVAKLGRAMQTYHPDLILSASVKGDFQLGYRVFLQDSHTWLAQGAVDVIYPMIYTSDDTLFTHLLKEHTLNDHDRHVYPGIDLEKNRQSAAQIEIARGLGCSGVALFSYNELFPNHEPNTALTAPLLQIWPENVPPAAMKWKERLGDTQGPLIARVRTLPDPVKNTQKFKILAEIIDPSGVFDDDTAAEGQGVYLVYDNLWPPVKGTAVRMSRIKNTKNWFMTDEAIAPQEPGHDFRCRIFAWDDFHESIGNPKRNMGYSDVWALDFKLPFESFIHLGKFGPVLTDPSTIKIDKHGQIWLATQNRSKLEVFNAAGYPMNFSPIRTGLDSRGQPVELREITGLALGKNGVMYVSLNSQTPMVLKFQSKNGAPLFGFNTDFPVGEIDCDAKGHVFALEAGTTRWHVLGEYGTKLLGGPFGEPLTGNDIAVLQDGEMVLISDRAKDRIQCWKGAVEGLRARYWPVQKLNTQDIGVGKVTVDSANVVYVANNRRGLISLFDRSGKLMGHLSGNSTALNAPMGLDVSASGDTLVVFELAGEGPTQLSRWVKNAPAISEGAEVKK